MSADAWTSCAACEYADQGVTFTTIKMPLAHAALPQPGQTIHVYAPPEHLRVYR